MVKKIIIAGGGTGGHVFPAIAIADAIKAIDNSIEIHFVGTKNGIELTAVPKAGYPLHLITITGVKNLSIFKKLKAILLLPWAFLKSIILIIQFRPDLVLGVGGYASGPFLLMSSLLRIPTGVWEPNSYPGLTNRLLSRFVKFALTVFDESAKFFNSTQVHKLGMPLRKGIVAQSRPEHDKLRVLIFGGSQGARGINNTVSDALKQKPVWLNQVEIVHQTGKIDFERIRPTYDSLPDGYEVHAFLNDMDKRYAWADVVFCRAGAATVAEVAAAKKACVFIPFPFAADNHQQKNAESLAQHGAALLVVQKDFTPQKFSSLIEEFIGNKQKVRELEDKIANFSSTNSSEKIAKFLLNR